MVEGAADGQRTEPGALAVSVIIPAYNEERRIGTTLDTVMSYLEAQPYPWEVIVVDDGSSDRTADLVRERAEDHEGLQVTSLPHHGKGSAVKHGMLRARGQYRLMCDADLAVSIEYLSGFLDKMRDGYDIAIASREKAGARRIGEPAFRHIRGRVFNLAIRFLAIRGIQDTQCGFKCFEGGAAQTLFGLQRTDGFGFDVEVLYLARKLGYRIEELPVDWRHRDASKIRLLVDWFVMLMDVVTLRFRDATGQYER